MASSKANMLGKRKPEDNLETKLILKKHKELSEEKEIRGRVVLSETKSDEASLKETVEGLDETPDFVEKSAVRERTVFVENFCSYETQISDVIDFFKDVGQVVRVRFIVNRKLKQMGCGFVEFASANEAKKALEEKDREYFHGRQIFVAVANKGARFIPPKLCIDHKAWYEEDYPQRESLPIKGDETPPDCVEDVAIPENTLFVANLSPQTTKVIDIINFFGKVASVRLIVSHEGKHLGHAFVQFPSANRAKRALKYKNGAHLHDHKIVLMKGLDKTPDLVEEAAVREKTLFVDNLSSKSRISDIIDLFKDVGQVVHVRLIVGHQTRHVGCGFVEFASANEAKKALEEKNGECLHHRKIFLTVAETAPYPLQTKHCIDHYVWYKDYLRGESLPVEEDAAVDETPDFLEEVAAREKTVFVASLLLKKESLCNISHISSMFRCVGEVVRVRLVADDLGYLVGCVFVEFASANEAKKAIQKKNGASMSVHMAEIARSYPFRPKYNLYKLAEKLWYEDNLRRERLDLKTTPDLKTIPTTLKEEEAIFSIFSGKKTTFSDSDDKAT
uniref:Polyadenylate-binding protein 3 n=1 Tax=Noccaea caerulescens TaxID=107243 RepID=A0A1J3GW10_NOCCA